MLLELLVKDTRFTVTTQLDELGGLVDVEKMVAMGHHASTTCAGCYNAFINDPRIEEEQLDFTLFQGA